MEFWGNLVLGNAATATALAAIVALAARRLGRASLVHALWLVVLVKLVTVPLFEVRLPSLRELLPSDDVAVAPALAALGPATASAAPASPLVGEK